MTNGLREFNFLKMNTNQKLLNIANELNYRSWFSEKQQSLKNEKMISAFDDVIEEAKYIDCIWFNGAKEIPAFLKISNNENMVESLCRLKNIKELLPRYNTNFILIAPDECIDKFSAEIKKPIFDNFDAKFWPLSKLDSLKTRFSLG